MSSSQTSGNLPDPDLARHRQMDAVFDGLPDGVLVLDAGGAVIRANPAANRMLGDTRFLDNAVIQRALAGETVSGLELPGTKLAVNLSVTLIRGQSENPSSVVVTLREITGLQPSDAGVHFGHLAESNMIGIARFGLDGRVLDANVEQLRLMGRTREDLSAGFSWKDVTPEVWHSADQRAIAELRAAGVAKPYEKEFLHKNGKRIPVLTAASLGTTGEGVAFTMDLNERKEVNEALRRTNNDLQQFAFVASHDLQEPLRMVASYTQLLSRKYGGQLGPEADEYIRFAVDGANRMSVLIRDLLQFSRFGFAELQPPQSTDLSVMVDLALLGLGTAVAESGAEIEQGTLPTVSVDQSQMTQVFQNLLGNAIKYRKAGEPPRIRISSRPEGDEWIIAVEDNGIGFDPEHAGSLFGVFKRLHGREYPGSGIGLAICKRIVERHGGRIWATSKPGEGSTFSFALLAD